MTRADGGSLTGESDSNHLLPGLLEPAAWVGRGGRVVGALLPVPRSCRVEPVWARLTPGQHHPAGADRASSVRMDLGAECRG